MGLPVPVTFEYYIEAQHQVSPSHCMTICIFQSVKAWITGLTKHEIMPAHFINLLPGYNELFYYMPNALQLYIL